MGACDNQGAHVYIYREPSHKNSSSDNGNN